VVLLLGGCCISSQMCLQFGSFTKQCSRHKAANRTQRCNTRQPTRFECIFQVHQASCVALHGTAWCDGVVWRGVTVPTWCDCAALCRSLQCDVTVLHYAGHSNVV
jgi:hypothetical protein